MSSYGLLSWRSAGRCFFSAARSGFPLRREAPAPIAQVAPLPRRRQICTLQL